MPTSTQRENASVPDSASTPTFESAVLSSYPTTTDGAITVRDVSSTTKVLVRSDQPQFGVAFGSSSAAYGALIAGTRPTEWLMLGTPDEVKTASAAVNSAGFTNVIPFTHGRALFRVTGEPATSMLEKVCGIDWSDNMTPNGAVTSASVALTTCDIIRNDVDDVPSYLLQCDRSFGQYLFDALVDAATEFGVNVIA